jgi:hypothetical protein
MSIKYFCDRCEREIVDRKEVDLCPPCYSAYKFWLKGSTKVVTDVEDLPLPVDDPNFQKARKESKTANDICTLATTVYKRTEFPSQIKPAVVNLLAQVDAETLIKAIQKVSDLYGSNGRDHDKRPGFARQFNSAEAVREMAKQVAFEPEKKISASDRSFNNWAERGDE